MQVDLTAEVAIIPMWVKECNTMSPFDSQFSHKFGDHIKKIMKNHTQYNTLKIAYQGTDYDCWTSWGKPVGEDRFEDNSNEEKKDYARDKVDNMTRMIVTIMAVAPW